MSAPNEPTYGFEEIDRCFDLYPLPLQLPDYVRNHWRVREVCVHVLHRMPKEATHLILSTAFVCWVGGGRSWTGRPEGRCRLVLLDPRLPCYSCDMVTGIVAHEFAHVVLGHERGGTKAEDKADCLAGEWGFGREIAAVRAGLPPPR